MHADLLKTLLPPVSFDPTGRNLNVELTAEGAALDASHSRFAAWLREIDPRTCYETLPEWERVYGLPDPCMAVGATLEERRAALVDKVTRQGGLSRAYFIGIASRLGLANPTIAEFDVFTCDSECDDTLYEETARFVWLLQTSSAAAATFMRCNSACDSFLQLYSNTVLECVIERLKPAHTAVLFSYSQFGIAPMTCESACDAFL